MVMSTAFNGRIDAAQREGKNLKVVWNGSIYDLDYWAIPKGTPNKALAEQYIAYTLSQKAQQEYAKHIAYGPANLAAIKALDAKTQANLPNSPENGKSAVLQNLQFWTDHGDEPGAALRLVGIEVSRPPGPARSHAPACPGAGPT